MMLFLSLVLHGFLCPGQIQLLPEISNYPIADSGGFVLTRRCEQHVDL